MRRQIKYLAILTLVIAISSCQFFVKPEPSTTQTVPFLPQVEEFYIDLDTFRYYTCDDPDEFFNYLAAYKTAEYWLAMLMNFDTIFYNYKALQDTAPEHFAGSTWYWVRENKNYKFELFATLEGGDTFFFEAYNKFIHNGQREKVLEGYYYPKQNRGQFKLFSCIDTLIINWDALNNTIQYEFISGLGEQAFSEFLNYKEYNTYWFFIATKLNRTDTTYIKLYFDLEGAVRDSTFFGDYQWHCWDSDGCDEDCD